MKPVANGTFARSTHMLLCKSIKTIAEIGNDHDLAQHLDYLHRATMEY